MTKLIDMGWGDLRLQDAPSTRVTEQQARTLVEQDTLDAGASEVRFGEPLAGFAGRMVGPTASK